MILGAIPITIGMMAIGNPAVLATVSPRTAAALAFVFIVPMFLCFYMWFKVVELLPVVILNNLGNLQFQSLVSPLAL